MEVSALIQSKVDEDAKVVLGVLYDETLGDEIEPGHAGAVIVGAGGDDEFVLVQLA